MLEQQGCRPRLHYKQQRRSFKSSGRHLRGPRTPVNPLSIPVHLPVDKSDPYTIPCPSSTRQQQHVQETVGQFAAAALTADSAVQDWEGCCNLSPLRAVAVTIALARQVPEQAAVAAAVQTEMEMKVVEETPGKSPENEGHGAIPSFVDPERSESQPYQKIPSLSAKYGFCRPRGSAPATTKQAEAQASLWRCFGGWAKNCILWPGLCGRASKRGRM